MGATFQKEIIKIHTSIFSNRITNLSKTLRMYGKGAHSPATVIVGLSVRGDVPSQSEVDLEASAAV
jgi:hypothetical protein